MTAFHSVHTLTKTKSVKSIVSFIGCLVKKRLSRSKQIGVYYTCLRKSVVFLHSAVFLPRLIEAYFGSQLFQLFCELTPLVNNELAQEFFIIRMCIVLAIV